MKPSMVYRRAAEKIANGKAHFICRELLGERLTKYADNWSSGGLYFDDHSEYGFSADKGRPHRVMFLLMLSEIAKDSE